MSPTKVIYIMGCGRSGSTLLGVALGNIDGVFYAGELATWPERRGVPRAGNEETRSFWVEMAGKIPQREAYFVDFRGWVEHPTSLLRSLGRGRRVILERYYEFATVLFELVGRETHSHCVVDSSHHPLRMVQLRKVDALDVYVVYLVRDPRATVNSFGAEGYEQPPKAPLAANLYCLAVSCLSIIAYLATPHVRRTFIRYEDFVASPDTSVARITAMAGIASHSIDWTALKTGCIFDANRIRLREEVAIEQDRIEQVHLTRPWRILTMALQLPFLLTFGYLRPRPRRWLTGRGKRS